jgi:hypothetical protein
MIPTVKEGTNQELLGTSTAVTPLSDYFTILCHLDELFCATSGCNNGGRVTVLMFRVHVQMIEQGDLGMVPSGAKGSCSLVNARKTASVLQCTLLPFVGGGMSEGTSRLAFYDCVFTRILHR